MQATKSVLIASLLLCAANVRGQSVDKDPAAIIEIGAAPARSLSGSGWSLGPTVALEVTPIENWLELEAGARPFFARHVMLQWGRARDSAEIKGTAETLRRGEGFNGAALVRARKLADVVVDPVCLVMLQWGRARESAEMAAGSAPIPLLGRASMGPRS